VIISISRSKAQSIAAAQLLRRFFFAPSAAAGPKSFAGGNAAFLFVKVNATPFAAFALAMNTRCPGSCQRAGEMRIKRWKTDALTRRRRRSS
jgi:hypothetical protein